MNPIFKEYCEFLKDKVNLELEEGYYWLDNSIIKTFDKEGNIHKLYRIIIDDKDLSMTYKVPKGYSKREDINIASWDDLIEMNKSHLENIESEAKQLIRDKMDKFNGYIPLVPVSMGKDSMVTCHLVRECFPDTKAIFNNTTLDCADTYRMVKTFPNCEMMTPKQGFYRYIKEIGILPTRFSRFCCRIFKTGEMVRQLDHMLDKHIEINPKYKKGYSRVGCAIACPYYTKSTWVLDKYWYPTMRKRWEDILRDDFISSSKWLVLNCTLDEYINQAWNGGVFREEPTEEVIKEYAEYSHLDENVARQYFNKYCANGCMTQSGKPKKIKEKDVIAMNMKLHGRNINKFYCKKCLMKLYNMDNEKWNSEVERFKQQGCDLF